MSSYELELEELLNHKFRNPYLVQNIMKARQQLRQFEWRAVHFEITEVLLFLNSSRHPGYVLFHYGPTIRKFCGEENLYFSNDSDSE